MTVVQFEKITFSIKKSLKCRTCGKRFSRSQTFWETLSPFNRNGLGQPKSRWEIREDLKSLASAWQPDDRCTACADADTATDA